jgi:uncharacterized Zn finger protein
MNFSNFPPNKDELETYFSSKILSRAKDIIAEDLVQLLERSSTHLTARVQGSEIQPYTVVVSDSGDYSCSCPSEIQPCKHVAAVLLYATMHAAETEIDLNQHLQSMDPAEAKTLLLELATISDVRPILLKRLLIRSSKSGPSKLRKGVIKALKKVLDDGKNIEGEGELGEAAFQELATLGADERSDEAWQIYELLDTYEPNEYYDPEDESGDAYWEDRQSEWQGLALLHWGTAEAELGRGEAALETILHHLDRNDSMWQAALELAKHVEDGADFIEAWLARQKPEQNYFLGSFQRDFLKQFGNAKAYEKHLRGRLNHPHDYLELVQLLQGQNRDREALELAARCIRQNAKSELKGRDDLSPYWGIYHPEADPLLVMLDLLKTQQPNFEWDEATFIFNPSLGQYRYLKRQKEFAGARDKLLKVPMENSLNIDLLLEDNDRPALEKLLKQYPTAANALKLKSLFPEQSKTIFKKDALEEIGRGSREHYSEGARWAEEYALLENKATFKSWLSALLETHKRRPALQDEFKKLRSKWL